MPDEAAWDYDLEGGGESQPFAGFPIDLYFTETEYGPKAQIVVRRSHPELSPNSPAEQKWNYNVATYGDKGWAVSVDGQSIEHAEGRKLNASTPFGKLYKSLRENAPAPIPGNPQTSEFWKGLESQGDFLWNWVETPKHKRDGDKWVVDTDKAPERNLVIVGYSGDGKTNGQVSEPVDLTTLGTFDQAALAAAVTGVTGAQNIQAALIGIPGVVANKELYAVILRDPEGLAAALTGEVF